MFSRMSRLAVWLPRGRKVREIEKSANVLDASSSEAALRSKTRHDLGGPCCPLPRARPGPRPRPGSRGLVVRPGGSRTPHSLLSSPGASGLCHHCGWVTGPSRALTSGHAGTAGCRGASQAGVSPGELGAGRRDDGAPEMWLRPASQQHGQNLRVTCSLHVNRSLFHLKWRA